jgi:hypothetical protein
VVKSSKPIGKKKYKKLASMGKISRNIINSLYSPVDAMNRFLNLALHNTEEESQSRQFLLETKLGLKRMSALIGKLDVYADKLEKEFNEVSRKRKL